MTTTLPVPIEFTLPNEHWEPVPPESLGVHHAAFLAVRRDAEGDYAPTISISGDHRPDAASLTDIADESVVILAEQADESELLERQEVGEAAAPGVTQLMRASVTIDGTRRELRQGQVLLALTDAADPGLRAVIVITLTVTDKQLATYVPEFQQMVATVRARNA
jgi:hypothetical protein